MAQWHDGCLRTKPYRYTSLSCVPHINRLLLLLLLLPNVYESVRLYASLTIPPKNSSDYLHKLVHFDLTNVPLLIKNSFFSHPPKRFNESLPGFLCCQKILQIINSWKSVANGEKGFKWNVFFEIQVLDKMCCTEKRNNGEIILGVRNGLETIKNSKNSKFKQIFLRVSTKGC